MSRVYRSAIEPVYAANEVKGYVMLVDYLRKEKKMGMKLVKLNI